MKRANWYRCGLVACAALAVSATAQVEFYTGAGRIGDPIGVATFDSFSNGSPLQDYREAGLRVHVDDIAYVFTPCGFLDSRNYYPNGGVYEMINITREDGEDFGAIEMNVSDGWASCTVYLWIRAYLNGELVNEFDADVEGGDLIGMEGTFDEVHLASYYTAATRDLHNPNEYNAIAIDNLAYAGDSGPSLVLEGSCPGEITATSSGNTPGGNVAFVYAFGEGNQRIPMGFPCAGTELGLNATAVLGGTVRADGSGVAAFSGRVPAGACNRVFVQALDIETCLTSNVEPL